MKRSLVARVCDFCTWQFFHLPASATPPASFWAYYLCAAKSRMTGDWLLDGSTYFKPLEQISGWARTAMFTHFWNNHQHSALLVLRLGWIWVWATGIQNMVQLPFIGWDESLAKLSLGSCAMIYFDKKELTYGTKIWIIRWDTWKPSALLYRFTISTVAHQISLRLFLDYIWNPSSLPALYGHYIGYTTSIPFASFCKFKKMKIAACWIYRGGF